MPNPSVIIETNLGNIQLELFAEEAPITVENFLRYVDDGYYADTQFHRVISGFMIQGGGLDKDLKDKPATYKPIQNEASTSGLKNVKGSVAMARTNDPHSATTQFFINLVDNKFLDFTPNAYGGDGYAVFAKVTEGMDVVETIAALKTDDVGFHGDVPVEPVTILSVTRVE